MISECRKSNTIWSIWMNLYIRIMNRGVAALPLVLIISTIILIAGLGIAGSGFIESLLSFGDYESKSALYVADAGAQDAFKRLVRNKNCSCNYSLTIDSGTANISVTGTNPKTMVSEGILGSKKRKIRVVVSWDANDKATYTEWKEVFD